MRKRCETALGRSRRSLRAACALRDQGQPAFTHRDTQFYVVVPTGEVSPHFCVNTRGSEGLGDLLQSEQLMEDLRLKPTCLGPNPPARPAGSQPPAQVRPDLLHKNSTL